MISDISPVNNYSGNGSATTFDFDFYIEDSSQLKVYKINSSGATIQLSEDIDYSVNEFTEDVSRPNPDFSQGGYITFPLASSSYQVLASDEKISLQLDIPFEQESEFGNSSLLNLNSLEFSLDYLTRLCQILKRQVARCAKIKEAVDVDPDSLSENINLLAEIKNDISTVSNAIDDVIVTSSNTENISSVAGSIENVNAVADDLENIDAVNDNKTNIDTVADSISDVNTVAESIQDVNSVAGSIADINDVADDLTNIDSVAGDLTNIDTVAGSIANVNSVADSISNVNSVAGNISNINAVKNNETNINAVNSNKTNIDTVAGSISNINTTAGSIANVNTVAGSIADINDVADDLTNINLVAGDLSNIDSASNYADNAYVWAEGTDADVQDLGGVHSAKGWAEVAASGQIQADWNQSDNTKKDFIKNKPTIPAAQIQSDWNQSDNTKKDFIKNKPTIPSISNLANQDLSNLTVTGETHFQEPLVSGTNIKTVNNTSLLGSGNIDTSEIFVATYGTTTFNEIKTAITNGKIVLAKVFNLYYSLTLNSSTVYAFSYFLSDSCYIVEVTNGNLWSNGSYTYQQTSTAVTHTASTAVGSSTKPIYISSTGAATASSSTVGGSSTPVYLNAGTITSTGLSIANTRFDGQWVNNFQNIAETSGTKNGVQFDLSSYLPNDTYKYDVKFRMYGFDNDSTYSYFINTDIFWMPSTSSEVTTAYSYLYGGTYSRQNVNIFDLPVGTGRYVRLYGSGADEIKVYALGYRRIGTNT